MGVLNPARIVAPHNAYDPSIDKEAFKKLVRASVATGNAMLVDGLITQIMSDINADNGAGNVNNQSIRNYYHDYYDMVSNCPLANRNLLNQLHNLV